MVDQGGPGNASNNSEGVWYRGLSIEDDPLYPNVEEDPLYPNVEEDPLYPTCPTVH